MRFVILAIILAVVAFFATSPIRYAADAVSVGFTY